MNARLRLNCVVFKAQSLMFESEPRAESKENGDHRQDPAPMCNRQDHVMIAELIWVFPKERQNMGPSVWHQRRGLDTQDTGPSHGG